MADNYDLSKLLKENSYPGRGIVIGTTPDGTKAVTAYFIMGRSANSRNRIFEEKGEEVTIYPFDASKVEDPSLIIYSPVRALGNALIVTNGDQTDTIYDFLQDGKCFASALETRTFEPDAPNYTPRISGILHFDDAFTYQMSILKCLDGKGEACGRFTYSYPAMPGTAQFLHTYRCDGNPIPSFAGDPEAVNTVDDIDAFADLLWTSLHADNKVSLYVRYTDLKTGAYETRLFNKNK